MDPSLKKSIAKSHSGLLTCYIDYQVVAHSKVPVVLLGNKADLEDRRKVDTSEGAQVSIQLLPMAHHK